MNCYQISYNGKSLKEIKAETRLEAIKKTKWWFEYHSKKLNLDGLARVVLTVSDPQKEAKYSCFLNVSSDEFNFLDKETLKRVISESRGYLRLLKPKEIKDKSKFPSSVRQLHWVKKDRSADKKVRLKPLPYLYKDGYGAIMYYICTRRQKTVNGKVVRKEKRSYVRLKSKNIKDAIKEIKTRRLNQKDKSSKKVEKYNNLKLAYKAMCKMQECLFYFKWSGFKRMSFDTKNTFSPIELKDDVLLFSPSYVVINSHKTICAELRKIVTEVGKNEVSVGV